MGNLTIGTERRISGTRISAIVGCNPYADAFDVWEEIVLGKKQPDNRFMARGRYMEPVIRSKYTERTGATLLDPKPEILEHHEYSWATYSPDDLPTVDGQDIVVDYKSANVSKIEKSQEYGAEYTAEIPEHYYLQLAWGMAISNRDLAHLYVVFGLDNYRDGSFTISNQWLPRLYVVRRDLALERNLIQAGRAFWTKHVLTKNPPAKTKKKRTRKVA